MNKLTGHNRRQIIESVAIAAFSFIYMLFVLHVNGLRFSPDSVIYLSAGKSLASGQGLIRYDGLPFANYPPLFPLIISLSEIFYINIYLFGKLLNLTVFALIISFSWFFSCKIFKDVYIRVVLIIFLMASYPLAFFHAYLWTEPLFILLLLIGVYFLWKYQKTGIEKKLFVSSVFLTLTIALRYAGWYVFVGSAVFILIFQSISFKHRTRLLFKFGLIPTLFSFMIVVRNYLVTKTLTGDNRPFEWNFNFFEVSGHLYHYVSTWFIPNDYKIARSIFAAGLLIFLVFFLMKNRKYKFPSWFKLMFIISLVYCFILIISSTFRLSEMPNYRLLSPIFIPLVFIVFYLLEKVTETFFRKTLFKKIFITGIGLIFVLNSFVTVVNHFNQSLLISKTGYSEIQFSQKLKSAIEQYGKNNTLVSNNPIMIYFSTNQKVLNTKLLETNSYTLPDTLALIWFKAYGKNDCQNILPDYNFKALYTDGEFEIVECNKTN